MKFLKAFLLLYILLPKDTFAQSQLQDSAINVSLIGGVFSVDLPGGDLAKRFGANGTAGAAYWFKSSGNWLFGAEYNYIFGSTIKETGILDSISTHNANGENYLINSKGELQILKTFQRGQLPMFKVGKIFPSIIKSNPNSGVFAKVGVGLLEHKIKYYWAGQDPPQLTKPYYKGYDRLTNGIALSQSIGFLKLDPRNYYNFSIEFEVVEGFTQNRRDWNFDTMEKDTRKRLDIMFGMKLSWFFPIYRKTADGLYFE